MMDNRSESYVYKFLPLPLSKGTTVWNWINAVLKTRQRQLTHSDPSLLLTLFTPQKFSLSLQEFYQNIPFNVECWMSSPPLKLNLYTGVVKVNTRFPENTFEYPYLNWLLFLVNWNSRKRSIYPSLINNSIVTH